MRFQIISWFESQVIIFVTLQAGSDLFPKDSAGELISGNTNFLDTWEVN